MIFLDALKTKTYDQKKSVPDFEAGTIYVDLRGILSFTAGAATCSVRVR